jgi:phenylalanyl-tRNA synthetase beta chain
MNASHEWLKALVPHDLSPRALRDLLTARTATVDELVPIRADLADIVVGRVVEAARHPDSDHLWVTKVDAGGPELLDVVCGAPNVRAGAVYPFAPAGTTIPGGLTLERRKIRGQWSNGMLCSARELKLGESHEGILELSTSAAPGTPLLDALPMGDTRIVVDVTPNRPDLLSHLGLGRELAAALGTTLSLPKIPGEPAVVPAPERKRSAGRAGSVAVHLEEVALAPRYMGVVIRGVSVGPSPDWLVQRLEAVGSRSINNVVDATNYVLHELGQPVHAFDVGALGGSSIVVRRAKAGETLVTLDGVSRALDDRITVIADATTPQAIAGVMGGRDSEVSASTKDLFVEVAVFDPTRTRAARRTLGLSTDASYRFERGVDIELPPVALERVAQLITSLAGGRVDGTPVDLYPKPRQQAVVPVRVDRVRRLLGEGIPAIEIARLLGTVGFRIESAPGMKTPAGDEELTVVVPSWREDVRLEADVIEEVARLHGYDAFPSDLRPFRPSAAPDSPQWHVARRLRDELVAAGLRETRPMPFVSGEDNGSGFVRVTNPLSENEAFLRRDVLDTLARRAEHNLAHMQGNVRIFEIGATFAPGDGVLPDEEMRAAALVMGARRPPHFTERQPPAFDEWDAKGLAERMAATIAAARTVELVPATERGALWNIVVGGTEVGVVRRVSLDAPVWASPAFGIELTLGPVPSDDVAPRGEHAHARPAAAMTRLAPEYRPIPTTPAVEMDLALLVPENMAATRVESVLRQGAGDLLEHLELLDEYRGKGIEPGMRSIMWRLTLRHPERTLREKEVEGRRDKLLKTLGNELGIRQRTT